jgi:ubiquinone biosynthesis protein
MESAIRTICEPIFDRPLKDISFGVVLLRLFEALQRFDGQIQPQLILLQKTLLNVEGLGRQLYPELDIWQTATPVLRAWMRARVNPLNVLREFRRQLPDALEVIKALPPLAKQFIERLQDGKLQLPVDPAALAELRAEIADGNRRRDWLLAGSAVLIAGAIIVATAVSPPWLGLALGASGIAALIAGLRGTSG